MPWPTSDLLLRLGPLSKEKVPPFLLNPALFFSSALQYHSLALLCAFSYPRCLFAAPNRYVDSAKACFQAGQFQIS